MSARSMDDAFTQLEEQINNCEQAVFRFIEVRKKMSDKPMSIEKINRQLQHNPIAIIGMASLFPQARNLREYWQNIVKKLDCITDVPATHWNIEEYYDPNPRTPEEKTYCKRGGFIPHVDFNPMEFGIPPNILEVTDTSQLLGLIVAKEAMEDAGYGMSRQFNRETVGVILGSAALKLGIPLSSRLQYPVWEKALRSSGIPEEDIAKIIKKIKSAYVKWDENAFPGMLANVISGRIANRLDLGGTNCTVDAACASSFAALKMAISELVEHRSDMMLTGGVDTDNSITAYISFSKTPAVTPGDKPRPFDAASDGMMLGEGIGMYVLKRLADAERDGDKVYAVIKGMGTSSDGRYKSIYAPRQEGQIKALQRAYEDAGFTPDTVTMVEAHGTGTMAGDPTEFGSLREFFGEHTQKKQYVALGTVKSQIGHTKAAAGAASLIKTALALHHKVLPPTINITQPNPKLNIKNSAFYLNTEPRPWIRAEGEAPRRAGVSSFGFGGTNYHVVLEEYQPEQKQAYRMHITPAEVILSAATPADLLGICEQMLAKLQSPLGEKQYQELRQVEKIPQNHARLGFVAESLPEAVKLLTVALDVLKNRISAPSWEHPQGIYYRASGLALDGKMVALFSGQGSQYLDMGRELVMNFPEMRRFYGHMDSLLLKDNLKPLSEVVFPHPVFEESERNAQVAALQRTEYAQPAIGMLSAGMYKIFQEAGLKADFVSGHSFGELTALWASGALTDSDYCYLVKARGQAMAAPEDPNYDTGAMLAVKEELSRVEGVLRGFPRVTIANYNSPRQFVLAGPREEINKLRQVLHEQGCTAVLLPVAAAFHTPLIAFAQKSFAIAIKSVHFQKPHTPVYTNVTGKEYGNESAIIQKTLETHLANSVLFKQQIENIYGAGGYCFVEFGPRNILTNLVKEILGDRPHIAIALNPVAQKNSDRSLREAAVQLRVAGVSLQNLDPYELPNVTPQTEKGKGLNVPINGMNYVSDKTKMSFQESLQDGHQVNLPPRESLVMNNIVTPSPAVVQSNGHGKGDQGKLLVQKVTEDVTAKIAPRENQVLPSVASVSSAAVPAKSQGKMSSNSEKPDKLVNYQQVLESLEYVLTQFQQNQRENLQVHSTYLNHQVEYAKTFYQLMQQQNSLLANSKTSPDVAQLKSVILESLDRSMMQFHAQQGDTLRVHEQYLQDQVEHTKNFFQLLQQEYAQIIAEKGIAQPTISTSATAPVSEKSPPSLKELFLNQQSVDNKQAPISEAVSEPIVESVVKPVVEQVAPPIPQPVVEPVPQPVVEPVVAKVEPVPQPVVEPVIAKVEPVPQPVVEPVVAKVEPAPQPVVEPVIAKVEPVIQPVVAPLAVPQTSQNTVDLSHLSDTLLAITSEKTGYPIEMLELDMDMEADLGIDSIKRVEIMGALQEKYPDLPKPSNVEELGELRTIAQIVEYLQKLASFAPTSAPVIADTIPEVIPEPFPPVAITIPDTLIPAIPPIVPEPTPIVTNAEAPSSTPNVDLSHLADTLLAITSDKTGYPIEMLELDMDMEADLGIDSIKRVEIMGALQEKYPDLPKPSNIEELGELRTIRQIVDYLQRLAGEEKKKPESEFVTPATLPQTDIQRRPAELQFLPPPDFWEFSLPEGYIALITDDGSFTTTKLAELMQKRGWKVVVLNFPPSLVPSKSPLPVGVSRVTLEDMSETHLQGKLEAIATQYGKVGTFIHLHPVFPVDTKGEVTYYPQEKAIVKQVFFLAKHLKKDLNAAASVGHSNFCTVAHLDGCFGLGKMTKYGAIGAGLFGLTKTLIWEWMKVSCRAIDISPDIALEDAAKHIFAEIHDPNRYLTEVAYGSQGRVTLISVPDC
ncbi:type I polyketide synthase [Calothrix sp. 336/3]|uniref:type I polyketide synthase n=1 Tax=Calothrix sp. 336/3 TaxID=1337936 RepID=UPI0004E3FD22|nr:type I polyketide synthase [Calothrix sp. 336/3]AKG23070.1 polyketide synthase [Calothrix sp. 336/3]